MQFLSVNYTSYEEAIWCNFFTTLRGNYDRKRTLEKSRTVHFFLDKCSLHRKKRPKRRILESFLRLTKDCMTWGKFGQVNEMHKPYQFLNLLEIRIFQSTRQKEQCGFFASYINPQYSFYLVLQNFMYFSKEDGIIDDCRVSILYQIGLNTILKAASRPLKITYLVMPLVLQLKSRLQKTLNVTHVF